MTTTETTAVVPGAGGAAGSQLVRGSVWLVASVLVQGASGFVFQLVAARRFPTDEVGNALALFASVAFVAYLTALGLPVAVARHGADDSPEAEVVFTWSLLATVVTSALGSLVYLALVSPTALGGDLGDLGLGWAVLLFAGSVAGASLAALVDIRLTGARRWGWVLFRMAAVGIVRIPPLFLLDGDGDVAVWVFALAAGTPAISGFVSAAVLVGRGRRFRLRPWPDHGWEVTRYAAVNHLANLAAQAPMFALPVIVLTHVTADANANFYVAFSITALLFLLPHTIGHLLLVEGAKSPDSAGRHARGALLGTVALMGLAAVAALVLSPLVVTLYGDGYDRASELLPALVAAGVPWAVTSVAMAHLRVHRRNRATVTVTMALAAGVLVPALVLVPDHGLGGVVAAWVAGNTVAALVAVVAVRWARR